MDEMHETRPQKLEVRTGKHVTHNEASLMLEYHRRQYSIERIAEDSGRDPATVRKALKRAEQLEQARLTRQAGEAEKPDIQEHFQDLETTLQKLLMHLKFAKKYELLQDETLDNIVLNEVEREQIEQLEPFLTRCLLSHIQAELTELSHLHSWGQLRVRDITDELLDKLSGIRYRRRFKGTCEICQGWR